MISASTRANIFRLIAGGVVACLFIIGMSAWFLQKSLESRESEAFSIAQNLSLLLVNDLGDTFNNIDEVLRVLQEDLRHSDVQKRPPGAFILDRIHNFLANHPEYVAIRITDANGEIILGLASGESPVGRGAGDRDYFIRHKADQKAGLIISPPLKGKISGKWGLIFSRRLENADGSFAGIVFANLSIDYFHQRFAALRLHKLDSIALRDGQIGLIARYPDISDRIDFGSRKISEEFKAALAANADVGSYVSGATSIDDVRRYHAYRLHPKYRYYANVGISREDALESWYKERRTAIAIVLVFVLCMAVGIFALIRSRLRDEQQESLLETSEARYRKLIDSSPVPIAVNDAEGNVTYLNPAFTQTLGYTHEDLPNLATWWLQAYPEPAYRQQVIDMWRAQMQEAERDGKAFEPLEVDIRSKNGTVKTMLVGAANPANSFLATHLVTLVDITERKAAEVELQRYRDSLEQMVAQRTKDLSDTQFALDRAGIAIHWVDTGTGQFLYVNQRAAAMLGYTVDELLQFRVSDLDPNFPPGDFKQITDTMFANGTAHFESVLRHKDGRLIPVELVGYVFPEHAGQTRRFITFLTDISQRKAIETKLLAIQSNLAEAQRIAGLGSWRLDLATNEVTWSEELYRMFNADPSRPPPNYTVQASIFEPESWNRLTAALAKTVETGTPYELELHTRRADGSNGWILARGERICDDTGKAIALQGISMDITQRKNAERLISEAKAAAEAASLAKSRFLANMSHEIRTPMNAIIGLTHILRRGIKTPEQADKLGKIAASADHLLGVINDILDISKIEAEKIVLEKSNFELETMLARISAMVIDRVHDKRLELVIDAEPEMGVVNGDATRLGQALLNYLGNAVKFTERGTITLRARILEKTDADLLVRFEVQDTGIGIPAEALGRLFQSFEQADNSTTRRFGGTGLGLAITKRLANLMGGDAGCDSTPDVGSTFWMTARLGRVSAEAGHYLIPELQGKRALVIDDTPVTRLVHTQLLRVAGLECESVASGSEAIRRVTLADEEGTPFDLLLVDMLMPEMDGFETLSILRVSRLNVQPMAWLVTASGDTAILDDAPRAGFDEVLLKPMSAAMLHDALIKHLPALLDQEDSVTASQAGHADTAAEVLKRDYRQLRVLLVEDDLVNQEVARDMLEQIGCQIDVASDGREAVELATRNPYDLILMDMQMPVMGGVEATRLIRQLPDRQAVPILAMTANAFTEDRAACFDAGMNDFLTKPVLPEKLYETLQKWVS